MMHAYPWSHGPIYWAIVNITMSPSIKHNYGQHTVANVYPFQPQKLPFGSIAFNNFIEIFTLLKYELLYIIRYRI